MPEEKFEPGSYQLYIDVKATIFKVRMEDVEVVCVCLYRWTPEVLVYGYVRAYMNSLAVVKLIVQDSLYKDADPPVFVLVFFLISIVRNGFGFDIPLLKNNG